MEKKTCGISDRSICSLYWNRSGNSTECTGCDQSQLYDKKIQEKKTYKNSKATYYYELPQLKGNSTAVKKINKSLKSYYTSDLKLKEELFRQFADYKKTGFLDANTENLFVKTKCTENYNKNGYIRFVYSFSWHGCGSAESNQTTLIDPGIFDG